MVLPIRPLPYKLTENNADWIHRLFNELWDQQQRLQELDGVRREHSLYGPQATRLGWIYPPSHRFLIKPQALLMPDVFRDDDDTSDRSFTSIEAVDGDTSIDSLGGEVISQWRDVFIQRGRREVDIVVTKKLHDDDPQIALLVVELKRDDLEIDHAIEQIRDYMIRILRRSNATDSRRPLHGLLVLGKKSIRLSTERGPDDDHRIIFPDGKEADGGQTQIETDSVIINRWLVEQANVWANF